MFPVNYQPGAFAIDAPGITLTDETAVTALGQGATLYEATSGEVDLEFSAGRVKGTAYNVIPAELNATFDCQFNVQCQLHSTDGGVIDATTQAQITLPQCAPLKALLP